MKCVVLFPLVVLGTFVLIAPAHAQESATPSQESSTPSKDSPLVEQAEKTKRERAARRSTARGPAKTFNNDSVKGAGKPAEDPAQAGAEGMATDAPGTAADGVAAKSTPPGAKAEKTEKTEKTDEQLRAEHRDAIPKKIDEQLKLMDIVREAMDEAQAELNDLTNYTMGTRRGALLKRLEDGKAEIAKAEQTIADLEEEARRQGISVSRP